jgi:hypothetical protein
MLASGQLRHLLSYKAFKDTGFYGMSADPIKINEYGELDT